MRSSPGGEAAKTMQQRWVYPMLACLGILFSGVLVFLFDQSGASVKGIGGTNLDIDFFVEDEQTKHTVPDARIEVNSEGGFYDGAHDEIGKFELKADAAGMANRQFRNAWFTDSCSRLHFTYTYMVRIPHWHVRAVAVGYEESPWVYLPEQYNGKVQHEGPQRDRLQIRIPLKKAGPG